jgi:hypothetical protein
MVRMSSRAVAMLAVVLAVLVFMPGASRAEPFGVVPLDQVVFGHTYGDWAAQWWQWALSLPATEHPLFDTADCSAGQSGPVWFLGAKSCAIGDTTCSTSKVVRACTVPAGKMLFFPVLNYADSKLEEASFGNPNATIAWIRAFLAAQVDGSDNLSASVDGLSVYNLKARFRVQAPVFSFTLPACNPPDPTKSCDLLSAVGEGPFAPGEYLVNLDDGVYLMLEPLRPGRHTIHFHGEFPLFNFGFDVTYYLTVSHPGG